VTRLAAVTGASGFLGARVAAELAAQGWRLRLLARRAPRLRGLGAAPVEIVLGDLAEPDALAALVAGADAVAHVAGAVKARDRAGFMAVNAAGAAALAAAVAAARRRGAGPARLALVSSMAARAPGLSDYAASKAEGEARAAALCGDLVILRPAAIYGPDDPATAGLVRALGGPVQPVLNHAAARLCLIHVADAARAIAAALTHAPGGAIWELSDARVEGYAWAEIAATAAAAAGRAARPLRVPAAAIRLGGALGALATRVDGRARMLTPGKAREMLHADWASSPQRQPPRDLWRPSITLAQGFGALFSTAR